MRRSLTPILLVCAAIGVACGGEKIFKPLALTTVVLTPAGATIAQGGSVTVDVTLRRAGDFPGAVNVSLSDVPTGVAAVVSNVQSTGSVATATLTLNVSSSVNPGSYSLVIHGSGTGIEESMATAAFALIVYSTCPASGVCEQWAESATASSQTTTTYWGANQATGLPNVGECGDDSLAWSSLQPNGQEWLELVYPQSVLPTGIQIYETSGVSSIVKVEVKDEAGTYYTVYTAQPRRQECPRVLTIPVTGISAMVNVVRVSFDQSALNDWDEIDAVKLIGNP